MIKKIINGVFSLNANSLGKLYDEEKGQENRRARKHSLLLSPFYRSSAERLQLREELGASAPSPTLPVREKELNLPGSHP